MMNEAMDTLKKERTGGRRSGVCSVVSGRSAVLVAVIWAIRMAVAPVDVLDALVPGGAFELVRRAFPLCILFCSADICAKNTHIFTHIYNHSVYIYICYIEAESAPHTHTLRLLRARHFDDDSVVDLAFFPSSFPLLN